VSRKRRRRGGGTADRPRASTGAADPTASAGPAREDGAAEPHRSKGEGPNPPRVTQSLARALRTVGSSPLLLTVGFLSLLATWGLFVSLGVEGDPRFLALLMAISPAHLFFTDGSVALFGGSPVAALGSLAGLAALRAVTFTLLILLIDGTRRSEISGRRIAGRLPRAAAGFAILYLGEVVLVVVLSAVLPAVLGQFSVVVIPAAIYFLALAPVVVTVEGVSIREGLVRGLRAVRLPGTGHLGLALAYFVLLYLAAAISPFGPLSPATPTVLAWAFALLMTFLHVSVLSTLVFRWAAVRDQAARSGETRGRR
jgi:hypothetical protein